MMGCTGGNNAFKEPANMGFNGKISTIEIAYYFDNLQENPWRVEVYSLDNNGLLKERLCYSDLSKKILLEKDSYKRDKDGSLTEEYKGFNLNDNHYIGESLWQRIEKDGNSEKWQQIDDDWWGTSYKEVTYADDKKLIKNYVIKKDSGEEVNVENITQTANDKGQLVSEKVVRGSHPENTTTWTYNENGQLVKVELEQVFNDGTSHKTEQDSFTINEVDDKGNPTLVTDAQGYKKTYKYTYR